jgi:hypothetical protein
MMPKSIPGVKQAIDEAAAKYGLTLRPQGPGTIAMPPASQQTFDKVTRLRSLMANANVWRSGVLFNSFDDRAKVLLFALSLIHEVLVQAKQDQLTEAAYGGYLNGVNEAKDLLREINTYVTNHGLDEITTELGEQAEINGKLQALHGLEKDTPSNPSSTARWVFRFLLLGLGFAALAPILMPAAALYGLYTSLRNSYKISDGQTPSDSPYGTRIHAMEKSNEVNPALIVLGALAEAVTATVFQPLRVIFLYDEWRPDNKRAFNQVETGFFNVLLLPVNLVRGTVKTWRDTFTNLYKVWNATGKNDMGTILSADPRPYGLSVIRSFEWFQEKPWRHRLAVVLQFILLPVDLTVGTLFNGLREYKTGIANTEGFKRAEQYVYGVATATWVGFLSIMMVYPAVMGVIGGVSAVLVGGIGGGSAAKMSAAFYAVWNPAVASWLPGAYTAIGAGLKAGAAGFAKVFTVGFKEAAAAFGEGIRAISLKVVNSLFSNTLAMRLTITGIALGGGGWGFSAWKDKKAAETVNSDNPRTARFVSAEGDAAKVSHEQARKAAEAQQKSDPNQSQITTKNNNNNGTKKGILDYFKTSTRSSNTSSNQATQQQQQSSSSSANNNNNNTTGSSGTSSNASSQASSTQKVEIPSSSSKRTPF